MHIYVNKTMGNNTQRSQIVDCNNFVYPDIDTVEFKLISRWKTQFENWASRIEYGIDKDSFLIIENIRYNFPRNLYAEYSDYSDRFSEYIKSLWELYMPDVPHNVFLLLMTIMLSSIGYSYIIYIDNIRFSKCAYYLPLNLYDESMDHDIKERNGDIVYLKRPLKSLYQDAIYSVNIRGKLLNSIAQTIYTEYYKCQDVIAQYILKNQNYNLYMDIHKDMMFMREEEFRGKVFPFIDTKSFYDDFKGRYPIYQNMYYLCFLTLTELDSYLYHNMETFDRNKAKCETSLYKSKIIYNWMLELLHCRLVI